MRAIDLAGTRTKGEALLPFLVEIHMIAEFPLIKETLTRMGVISRTKKSLNQTCGLLHYRGRYYICHFKLLYNLLRDGNNLITEADIARQNYIIRLLEGWGKIKVKNLDQLSGTKLKLNSITVLKIDERKDLSLRPMFDMTRFVKERDNE